MELNCLLCQSTLKYSTMLACGHSLCFKCAEQMLNSTKALCKQVTIMQDRIFKCPFCLGATVVSEISLAGFSINRLLGRICEEKFVAAITSCSCGKEACQECVDCQLELCDVCKTSHDAHYLIEIQRVCEEHLQPQEFYCENERVALCEVCAEQHMTDGHVVMCKDEAIMKYWTTIQDLMDNKAELLAMTDQRLADFGYFDIVSRSPRCWPEIVSQVLELKLLGENQDLDMRPFLNEHTPITRSKVESILSVPAKPNDLSVLVYVVRGSSGLFSYDFNTGSITHQTKEVTILRWSGITQIDNNTLFVTGGKPSKDRGAVNQCFFITLSSAQSIHAPNMISAHSSHASLLVENRVYVISGKNNLNGVTTSCEYFDLEAYSWQSIPSLNVGRTCTSAVSTGKFIYAIGGCKNSSIEKYEIGGSAWDMLLVAMPDIKWQHSSVLVGEKIFIFGGEGGYDDSSRNSYYFDTEHEEFHEFQEMPVGQSWLSGWCPVLVRGMRIWVMSKDQNFLTYNILSHKWAEYKLGLNKPVC